MNTLETALSYSQWMKKQRDYEGLFVVANANDTHYLAITKYALFWCKWIDRIHFRDVKPLRVELFAHLEELLESYKQYRTDKSGKSDYGSDLDFDGAEVNYLPYTQWEAKHLALCREHWYSKELGEPYPQKPGGVRKEQPEQLRRYQGKS